MPQCSGSGQKMKTWLLSTTLATAILHTNAASAQNFNAPDEGRAFSTIIVTGNDRFRDGDILATSGLRTGESYTEGDIVAAVESLEFTGEFRDVRIFSSGETLTIQVDEEPDYQGALSFGLGADSDIGVFGIASLRLQNIIDGNTDLSADLSLAKEFIEFDAGISSTDFWPGARAGGVRVSFGDYDYDDTLFDFQTARLTPFLIFGDTGGVQGEFRFSAFMTDITSVDADASAIVQAEAGDRTVFGPGLSLRWSDQTDGPRDWSFGIDADVYTGDADFAEFALVFSSSIPSFANTTLRTRGRAGILTGSGTTVADRANLGGSSMRGFSRGGISARDVCLGCGGGGEDVSTDLGGDRYAVLQNDLILPLFDDGSPLSPSVFVDVGTVWSVDTDTAPSGVLTDDLEWRSSAGLALLAITDFGEFSASYALSTSAEDGDDESKFSLSFASQF